MDRNMGRKVKRQILKMAKPQFVSSLNSREIEAAMSEALKGATDGDLAVVLRHGADLCVKCGECCRRSDPILLSDEDVTLLCGVYGAKRAQQFIVKRDGRWFFRRTKPCAFLKDNKCSIYEFRPLVCRTSPFAS
jgi:hypothetical protein